MTEKDYYNLWVDLPGMSKSREDINELINELDILGLDLKTAIKKMLWTFEVGEYNNVSPTPLTYRTSYRNMLNKYSTECYKYRIDFIRKAINKYPDKLNKRDIGNLLKFLLYPCKSM